MTTHFIFMSSSYSLGTRIAYDFVGFSSESLSIITGFMERLKKECGDDVSVSLHSIESKNQSWASVGEADPFFKDVKIIDSEERFISLIKKDRKLSGLDVAKYILSVVDNCTHLKLEKLVYLCYADFLCAEKEKLFEDKIFAYRYGPVVKSVYDYYKSYAGDLITEKEMPKSDSFLSIRSRILFSAGGLKKLSSIIDTLSKYQSLSAGSLIDLTHRKRSPWAHSDSTKIDFLISDESICKYHVNEK